MIPSRPGFSTVSRAVRMMPCVRGGGGGKHPTSRKIPNVVLKGVRINKTLFLCDEVCLLQPFWLENASSFAKERSAGGGGGGLFFFFFSSSFFMFYVYVSLFWNPFTYCLWENLHPSYSFSLPLCFTLFFVGLFFSGILDSGSLPLSPLMFLVFPSRLELTQTPHPPRPILPLIAPLTSLPTFCT